MLRPQGMAHRRGFVQPIGLHQPATCAHHLLSVIPANSAIASRHLVGCNAQGWVQQAPRCQAACRGTTAVMSAMDGGASDTAMQPGVNGSDAGESGHASGHSEASDAHRDGSRTGSPAVSSSQAASIRGFVEALCRQSPPPQPLDTVLFTETQLKRPSPSPPHHQPHASPPPSQPPTTKHTVASTPSPALPASSQPSSSPSQPSIPTPAPTMLSLSQQRRQIRVVSLLLLIPLVLSAMHVITALLDFIQSGSLYSIIGLHQLVDMVAGSEAGLSSEAGGANAVGSASDLLVDEGLPGDVDPGVAPPTDALDPSLAGNAAGKTAPKLQGPVAHIVTWMVGLQSSLLDVWGAAFDAQSRIEDGLTWWHTSTGGMVLQRLMQLSINIWAVCISCSIRSICLRLTVQAVHQLKHLPQHIQRLRTHVNSLTASWSSQPTAQATPATSSSSTPTTTTSSTATAPTSSPLATIEATAAPLGPLLCPAADTVLRLALGLCVASPALVPLVPIDSDLMILTAVALQGLSVVVMVASLIYLIKAWRFDSVKFFTKSKDELLDQLAWVLLGQAVILAVIAHPANIQARLASLEALTGGVLAGSDTAAAAAEAAASHAQASTTWSSAVASHMETVTGWMGVVWPLLATWHKHILLLCAPVAPYLAVLGLLSVSLGHWVFF